MATAVPTTRDQPSTHSQAHSPDVCDLCGTPKARGTQLEEKRVGGLEKGQVATAEDEASIPAGGSGHRPWPNPAAQADTSVPALVPTHGLGRELT